MFSEELLELDRNTVEFMIEDMRRQIEEKDEQIKPTDISRRGGAHQLVIVSMESMMLWNPRLFI